MTTETTNAAVETAAAAADDQVVAKKAPVKKAAKKAAAPAAKTKAAGKKAAKKAPAKKTAPAKKAGPTIRARVFDLLKKNPNGLTGPQIKEKLGLGGIPDLLKDEGVCDKPRIKRQAVEGVRGVVYQLTAAGKAAVEKGTVDKDAAPRSAGQTW